MKALSIKQPWAELILRGIKDVENRSWETAYRGQLLIHAGKNMDKKAYQRLSFPYELDVMMPMQAGILGVCELVTCTSEISSKWHERGYTGLYLMNPQRFAQPIPFKGDLYIFDVPDELVHEAMEEIDV